MTAATRGRKAGPNFWLSLAIFLIGLALGVVAVVGIVNTTVHALSGTKFLPTPGSAAARLSAGTYVVYEVVGANITGATSGPAPIPATGTARITPADVTLVSASNVYLRVTRPPGNANVLGGSGLLSASAQFVVTTPGTYYVSIQTAQPNEAMITHNLGVALGSVIRWAIILGIGAAVTILGIVLMIVGRVRRSRVRAYASYQTLPPTAFRPTGPAPSGGSWRPPPPQTPAPEPGGTPPATPPHGTPAIGSAGPAPERPAALGPAPDASGPVPG
jgi:hypothetical protein